MPLCTEDDFGAVTTDLVMVLKRDDAKRDAVGFIDNLFEEFAGGAEINDDFELGVATVVNGRVFVGVAVVNFTAGRAEGVGALSETDLRIELGSGLFSGGDNFTVSRGFCLIGVLSIDGINVFLTPP